MNRLFQVFTSLDSILEKGEFFQSLTPVPVILYGWLVLQNREIPSIFTSHPSTIDSKNLPASDG